MYKQKCSLDEAMRLAQVRRPRISPFGHLLTLLSLWERAFLCRPSSSGDDSTSSGDETDARRTEYRGSGGRDGILKSVDMMSPHAHSATRPRTSKSKRVNLPLQNFRIVNMRSCPGKGDPRQRKRVDAGVLANLAFNSADGSTGNFLLGLEHSAPEMRQKPKADLPMEAQVDILACKRVV